MNERLQAARPAGPIAVRKWIGDVSAERVGQAMADGGSRWRSFEQCEPQMNLGVRACWRRARGDASETSLNSTKGTMSAWNLIED